MDQGAALIKKDFGYSDALRSVLEQLGAEDWVPTHPDGPYESDGWKVVPFVEFGRETPMMERFPVMAKVLQEFKCPVKMMVYYNMLPGAKIHPHRDTSGTLELGFLRFHVPIRTNEQVDFRVDNVAVPMREGQLWALNTSHKHAVSNLSNSDRVHLVLEVEVNHGPFTGQSNCPFTTVAGGVNSIACCKFSMKRDNSFEVCTNSLTACSVRCFSCRIRCNNCALRWRPRARTASCCWSLV